MGDSERHIWNRISFFFLLSLCPSLPAIAHLKWDSLYYFIFMLFFDIFEFNWMKMQCGANVRNA